jgi:hypothetical protein
MPDMSGMGGGMGGGGEDPAVVDEALTELAAEMGVPPEQLTQMLASEEGGAAMPPPAAESPADMPKMASQRRQVISKLAAARSVKTSAVQRLHHTRQKIAIKRRALEVLSEKLQRGTR